MAPYPSLDALMTRTHALADAAGAEVQTYGRSVQGRPLLVVRTPSTRADAPRVLCSANIHGPEFIGAQVALGVLASLQQAPLRNEAEVWVAPCLNPDGYARTWETGGHGPLSDLRTNANGVDLNRNYPLPSGAPSWLPGAGSPTPGDATFRGTAPLSEPETANLDRLCTAQGFVASANLHSFMGTIIPASVRDRVSFRTYKALAKTFAAAQPTVRYRRLSARVLDVFTGEQEDHQHHVHGTWAACIESFPLTASFGQHLRAPSTFWRFNPRDPAPWVANDVPGVLAFLSAALRIPHPHAQRKAPAG
ncbi:MAG: M14 family metallopeptidase [Myxococcota bacterium]